MLISNLYAKSSVYIIYKIANLKVIKPKADASFYVINSKASNAKAPRPNLQVSIYK